MIGEIRMFYTPFESHERYNGRLVTILRELDESERDPEVELYEVEDQRGERWAAFPEELE